MIDLAFLAQAAGETAEKTSYFNVLVTGGGPIGYILWALNILTWALAIKFFIDIRRETILPAALTAQLQEMFENRQYREALEVTETDPSYIAGVMNASLSQASFGYSAMERGLEEAAEERTTGMLRNIEWLNLIGNIGPMLGLMGTVWGMIGAFFSIVEVGKADPKMMAKDIGVALVTTLLGLVVAVPALSVYAIIRNKIDGISSEAMVAAQEMISQLRPTKKSS
ncbi:MAG: MotA/TolQ/ExbB proton channel family protein [Planctomycetota bacterium]|jgi:biopolymer transport protein ExbB